MNLGLQIVFAVGTPFAVFLAALLTDWQKVRKAHRTLTALTRQSKSVAAKTAYRLGARNERGDTAIQISPNSPTTVDMKLAQIAYHIEELEISLSKEEELWLTALMLNTAWSQDIFMVILGEEMDEYLPAKPGSAQKVTPADVDLFERDQETIAVINLAGVYRYYSIRHLTRQDGISFLVLDGMDMQKPIGHFPSFEVSIEKLCEHFNTQIKKQPNAYKTLLTVPQPQQKGGSTRACGTKARKPA